MIDGNISPKVDKHTAPISEMNGPMFGMATATTTVPTTSVTRIAYSAKFLLLSEKCPRTFFHIISIGTKNCNAYVRKMAIAMLSLTDCANLLVYEQAKENIYYYCAFFKKKRKLYFEFFEWKLRFACTYTSFNGKLNVILTSTLSPYLRYPRKPTNAYKMTT